MDKFCKDLVRKIVKKLRAHLRNLFSSNETRVLPPTGHVTYVDKDKYRSNHPNYKQRHQRHEQHK